MIYQIYLRVNIKVYIKLVIFQLINSVMFLIFNNKQWQLMNTNKVITQIIKNHKIYKKKMNLKFKILAYQNNLFTQNILIT